MYQPKISIVIPSFNKVRYIRQTLESIINQGYTNLEVIIQDGGSTDGTSEIIKGYVKKYPKLFRCESQKDKGQLDAINKGFNKASGDIFAFINADDVYRPGAFSEVAKAYQNNPGGLWFAGSGSVIDSKGREIAKTITTYKNFLLNLNSLFFLLCVNYLMQPSIFISRSVYEKVGPFTGTPDFVAEYYMWLKISKIQMPVIIPRTLSDFRIEPNTKTKQMAKNLLGEDEKIVHRYTNNQIILFIHKLHNFGRVLVGKSYEKNQS